MAQMFPLISGFSSCPVRCSTPSASSTSFPTSEDDVVVVAETDTETTDDNNNSTFERTRFAIPWGKVPTRVMKKLKKGKRPTPSERLETLRIISAELKEAFSPDPVLRFALQKLIDTGGTYRRFHPLLPVLITNDLKREVCDSRCVPLALIGLLQSKSGFVVRCIVSL